MKILLRNTQPLLGDRLMFTPCVRDLKAAHPDWRIGVVSAGPEIWANNPHIDASVTEANAEEIYDIGPAKVTHSSKTNGLHVTAAFLECLNRKAAPAMHIPQGAFMPDVHLSAAEKQQRWVDGPYWVINCDTGPFTAKRWPLDRFQAVVDAMPEMTFVQVGLSGDCRGRLKGDNVIDMIDRTKIRELFSLVYHAEACISLVSSLMHVAAAFAKPCVVVAGGREPPTFERYPFHRYIDNVGTLPCCKLQACWHNALSACEDHDEKYARCMKLIEAPDVVSAVRSYYRGGCLSLPRTLAATAKLRPLLRIVAKGSFLGGAERSWTTIAGLFIANNWRVEVCPPEPLSPAVVEALPAAAVITNHISRPCDCLLLYASDMVFGFDQEQFKIFERIDAGRKVMALTYKIGKAGDVPWTIGWDKYLFLSTTLRDQFLAKTNDRDVRIHETDVLAPCVDLDLFLKAQQEDGRSIRVLRHSSQGDKKFPSDLPDIIKATPGVMYKFKPAPSWMSQTDQIKVYPYNGDALTVASFLRLGNCFWYLLPAGYTDQGPRTIVEAMAAGLPVIAEKRDGARDRVTPETGWLLDSHDQAAGLINSLTPEVLAEKGRAARQRAIAEFVPEKWFDAIAGA